MTGSMVFAGMLAFNLLVTLLPMAITFFGIFGLVLGSHPELRNRIRDDIVKAFPGKAGSGIREIMNMAFRKLYKDAGLILIVGILFAILGSSRLFVAIDRCLTIVYRVEETSIREEVSSRHWNALSLSHSYSSDDHRLVDTFVAARCHSSRGAGDLPLTWEDC